VWSDGDFAARLDRRRLHFQQMRLIEAKPIEEGTKLAKEEGTKLKVIEPKVIDHSLPPPKIDPRFRRRV
jgi:hypothetical protein